MEAPEKIYLFENPISKEPDYRWLSKRSCNDDIEYIRTDAFIEKMQDWIKNKAESFIVDTPVFPYFDYKKAIEDFLKII